MLRKVVAMTDLTLEQALLLIEKKDRKIAKLKKTIAIWEQASDKVRNVAKAMGHIEND